MWYNVLIYSKTLGEWPRTAEGRSEIWWGIGWRLKQNALAGIADFLNRPHGCLHWMHKQNASCYGRLVLITHVSNLRHRRWVPQHVDKVNTSHAPWRQGGTVNITDYKKVSLAAAGARAPLKLFNHKLRQEQSWRPACVAVDNMFRPHIRWKHVARATIKALSLDQDQVALSQRKISILSLAILEHL